MSKTSLASKLSENDAKTTPKRRSSPKRRPNCPKNDVRNVDNVENDVRNVDNVEKDVRNVENRPSPNSQIPDTSVCSRGRPSKTAFTSVPSATPFHCVRNLVPDRELAQVLRQIFQENQPDLSCILLISKAQSEQKVMSKVC